jgi:hypothetical protein
MVRRNQLWCRRCNINAEWSIQQDTGRSIMSTNIVDIVTDIESAA